MSEILKPLHLPCTLGDVLDIEDQPGWIARTRNALPALNMAVRRTDTRIEACSRGNWAPIMLPGGGVDFVSDIIAEDVLARLKV